MKKKEYIVPSIRIVTTDAEPLLGTASKIGDDPSGQVTPEDEPYGGEFNALDNSIWDD